MAAPTESDWEKLKRLGRYLVGKPRVVTSYPWQERIGMVTGYSDSEWAGCRKSGKSTSGGVILRGCHYIRSWISTQKCVTLSSAEVEVIALVRTNSEVSGICQLAADWEDEVKMEVLTDSAAALGVTRRMGCGKLRHVRVGHLWVQEKQHSGELGYRKTAGSANPADV